MMAFCCSVVLSDNFADYGRAVFVEDGTDLGVCDSNPHQVSLLTQEHTLISVQILNQLQNAFLKYLHSLDQQSDNLDCASGIL